MVCKFGSYKTYYQRVKIAFDYFFNTEERKIVSIDNFFNKR
jgi:hypothetical protein